MILLECVLFPGYYPFKKEDVKRFKGLKLAKKARHDMLEQIADLFLEVDKKYIDIFEKATDVSKLQMAEAYMTKAVAMMLNNRCREAIDLMLDKAIPNFVDDNGQPVEKVTSYVYPSVVHCYELLLEKTPKDKKLLKEYQQFLSDTLLIASFLTTDKKRNLFGDYLLLERGTWTLEKPAAVSDDHQILLQKDDEYIEYVREKDEERTGEMHVIVVDPAKKQDIINKWKAYKKRKK